MEVSALTGEGIEEAFESLCTFMLANRPEAKRATLMGGSESGVVQGGGTAGQRDSTATQGRHPFLFFLKGTQDDKRLLEEEQGKINEGAEEAAALDRRVDNMLERREQSWWGRWTCW